MALWRRSISAHVMNGNLSVAFGYQTGIYRAYALLQHGSANVNALTRDEKRELQLVVQVAGGSTSLLPDLTECLTKLLQKCGEEVKPKHVIITILALGLMYFGGNAWRDYLQNRVDVRKIETSSKEMKEVLQHLEYAGTLENERLNLIAGLAQSDRAIETVMQDSQSAHRALLKGISNADTAKFDSATITAPVARELIRNTRQSPQEMRMDGVYRIVRVNSGHDDGFLINLRNVTTNETFTAQLDADFPLSESEKAILSAAEWKKRPVQLKINARKIGKRIINAVILGVAEHEDDSSKPD